ncbi:MAG: CRTAC1 family protein [Deltaproteobacteria bacterium]|nr:CRTAC1 family protein [Deltaproteobacteria bacterium]
MADPLQHTLGVQGLADDRAVGRHRCIWLGDCLFAIRLVSAALLLATLSGCGEDRAAFPQSLDSWIAHRQQLEQTVWADELIAQQYERTLVALWDALLRADRNDVPGAKAKIFAAIDFDTLTIGTPGRIEVLDHGIAVFEFRPPYTKLTRNDWATLVERLSNVGYRPVQSEWHHARFIPPSEDSPARSQVAIALHLTQGIDTQRIIIEGELAIVWSKRRDDRGNPIPALIEATALRMLTRSGPAPFVRAMRFEQPTRDGLSGIHPVLLYDLDEDGLLDLIMVGATRILWNRGNGRFQRAPLVDHPYKLTETGVIADMNGDSHPDLISTRARGDLVLYLGNEEGRFPDEPKLTPRFEQPLRGPSSLTVGDVDGDGDLDVWLAQYRPPYSGGQMPTPYYDANDGFPSYLLLNDGQGNLSFATAAAGLEAKRFRRTYASTLVDLDDDADLDLLVISDFSGIDLYHNDGRGHFTDANDTLRADRHLFGMSAAFADYDLDGRLDFFVAGMASTVAPRLHAMGLGRAERPDMQRMRMRMAFGNRMYLASDDGWQEPDFRAQVARTGWTWGTTAFDFDNDRDPDLFAANGHISGSSAKDFCVSFWCHDIYDGVSEPNEALGLLMIKRMKALNAGAESWDGHQKNQLLMNLAGHGFVNVAFLLGIADSFDSRSAVSGDLDLDGRVDLVVVEDHGLKGQRLHVYQNRLETGNHWIGIRLLEEGNGISPVGASVSLHTAEQTHVGRIVTGETVMGQHPTTLHFGLGSTTRVESIEVRWQNGMTRIVHAPEIDRYHRIDAPRADQQPPP